MLARVTVLVAGAAALALTLPVLARDTKAVIGLGRGPGPFLPVGLLPEEEGTRVKGRRGGQPRAGPGGAGIRRSRERGGEAIRAVSVDRAVESVGGQDHRDHARLSDDHGY